MRILAPLFVAILALPATAQEYWEYKDWRVWTQNYDTGEDQRRNCSAWTGGDGDPTLRFDVSNGDAGPPYAYPAPLITETAPRHHSTQMQDGETIYFRMDSGAVFSGTASASFTDGGLRHAEAMIGLGDTLPILRAMKKGNTLEVQAAGRTVFHASLAGFTAAYGKMMDLCGFSLSLD